jgi:hypothetical protein
VDLNELVKILLHDEANKEIYGEKKITRPCSSKSKFNLFKENNKKISCVK